MLVNETVSDDEIMSNYQLKEQIVDAKTVARLRQSVGWDNLTEETLGKALANSILFASIYPSNLKMRNSESLSDFNFRRTDEGMAGPFKPV